MQRDNKFLEEIEILDIDDKTEEIEILEVYEPKKKSKNKIFDKFLDVIANIYLFFIDLFLNILYKLIIFIPYIFGVREFPKLEKRFNKIKKYPELFVILFIIIGTVYLIANFTKPTSPNKITKAPEKVKIEEKQSKETYEKLQETKTKDLDINELKNINNDVMGWVRVDGTSINYPFVQTTDNDYYIDHDIYKNYNNSGSIFGDYRNNWNLETKNIILYGHHLINGSMFGSISKMFTSDWQKNSNHLITTKTFDKTYTWEVFSVYETSIESTYLKNEFKDDNEYNEFITKLKNKSNYDYKVDMTRTTNIITLSTCNNTNTGRLVVHARLIKSE